MAIQTSSDSAKLWSVPFADGMELLHAVSMTHSYPRHWHDTYVIEVVENGSNGFFCSRGTFAAESGSIMIFHPGEIHTGYPLGPLPLVYRSFYPKQQTFSQIARENNFQDNGCPEFAFPVIHDPLLAQMISGTHSAFEKDTDPLQGESLLQIVFSRLVASHSVHQKRSALDTQSLTSVSLRPALEYFQDNFKSRVSLQHVADLCHLSRFHFLRVFKKTIGLPPFEYVTNLRVQNAREMLARGKELAESALESGFCDQSHLNRHFKSIVGVTPGRYRAVFSKTRFHIL